jgi:protein involved in polysaccharide export with SLBB domain
METPRAAVWFGLLALLLGGCSSGPGNQLTLFPQRHTLLESAKDIRQQYTGTLPLPRELDMAVQPLYTVDPGDVLLIQPVNLDSPARLPGDQPVLIDGTINLGQYGLAQVAGKTVPEIEALVSTAVAAKTKDAGPISVRVVTRQSKVYYVLGEVNAPGMFPLQGHETVLKGILAAGGLNDRASRINIVLARPTPAGSCRIVLPVCYREITQLGDPTTNYQLAPGDRIYVATRTFGEDLFHCRHEKTPCGCGPQMACPLGAAPAHVPQPYSALPAMPQYAAPGAFHRPAVDATPATEFR